MPFVKCIPYRPHDYMYDPIFTVSGPVDHYKAAMVAKMSSIKFQLCPVFPHMFSDLPNYPRMQIVERRTLPVLSYQEKLDGSKKPDPALHKQPDVAGSDRVKFFCPIVNLPPKDFIGHTNNIPVFTIQKTEEMGRNPAMAPGTANRKDVLVGTMYRESSAQTIPWQPSYKVIGDGDPEILKLDFLKWGSGLPAGVHEIRLIERARMKRAWENEVTPNINDQDSLQRFRDYVEAFERDEWAFREKEIQEIQDLRLHLLEKMLDEVHQISHSRAEQKLQRIIQRKEQEKKQQMEKIKKRTERELRKLKLEQQGISRRYRKPNIIEEHSSKQSELYGPLKRNGENPKRWSYVIDEKMKKYKAQFIGVEQFSTLPRWLDEAIELKEMDNKNTSKSGPQLCIRETKWTAPVLKQLHEELQNLRKETVKKPCSLRIRNEQPLQDSYTPEVEGIPLQQEEQYQSIVLLQSIIKGRAVQMMIYEGRDNCKELIQELKNSIGLLKRQKELRSKEKLKVRAQQREETIQSVMVSRLQGTLGKLQGQVVGSLLDFLNKELKRLLEERKAHALCWMNERERHIREAAEAGRRQKEIRRRKEHDEIFRQIVKVTQESVDVYLHDIITEGIEFASKEEATNYVLNLADKLDKEVGSIDQAYALEGTDLDEETVANLVHHFVLPEVQKTEIRHKIAARQRQNLKTIHEAIYSKTERLPKPKITPRESIEEPPSPSLSVTEFSYESDISKAKPEHPQDIVHPDILEIYLNQLAIQDEPQQEGEGLNLMHNYMQYGMHQVVTEGYTNNLETIVELTESVTSSGGSVLNNTLHDSDV